MAFITTNGAWLVPTAWGDKCAEAVLAVAVSNPSAVNTNLYNFYNTSAASNQSWGGTVRGDIYTGAGTGVTSSDALEFLKVSDGSSPTYVTSPPRIRLTTDELYEIWDAQAIGYFGDSAGDPMFIPNTGWGIQVIAPSGSMRLDTSIHAAILVAYGTVVYPATTASLPSIPGSGTNKAILLNGPNMENQARPKLSVTSTTLTVNWNGNTSGTVTYMVVHS